MVQTHKSISTGTSPSVPPAKNSPKHQSTPYSQCRCSSFQSIVAVSYFNNFRSEIFYQSKDQYWSLRCVSRQGSTLRSDELREHKTVRSALDCLPRFGSRIDKSC